MLKAFLLLTIFISFDVFSMNCRFNYRYESFYLGAGLSFGEDVERPNINDEVCWQAGIRFGENALNRAIEDRDEDDCYEAFDDGVEQGLEARQTDMEYPQYCYDIGLKFGFSLLATGARDSFVDIVGEDCVEEYKKGYAAAMANRPITVRPNTKLAFCYRTGYRDAGSY